MACKHHNLTRNDPSLNALYRCDGCGQMIVRNIYRCPHTNLTWKNKNLFKCLGCDQKFLFNNLPYGVNPKNFKYPNSYLALTRWNKIEAKSISDYQTVSDSKSLKEIDGKEFTIVAVEDSNYDDTPGVKITTKESFKVGSELVNKYHTTRFTIVKFFTDEVRADLKAGKEIKATCVLTQSQKPGGKDYWLLK